MDRRRVDEVRIALRCGIVAIPGCGVRRCSNSPGHLDAAHVRCIPGKRRGGTGSSFSGNRLAPASLGSERSCPTSSRESTAKPGRHGSPPRKPGDLLRLGEKLAAAAPDVRVGSDGLADSAHLTGLVVGFASSWLWPPRVRARVPQRRRTVRKQAAALSARACVGGISTR